MRLYYQQYLNSFARKLRKSGNLAEVILWNELKNDKLDYRFLRQRPIDKYIVDFYCYKLNLVIEIDGTTHNYKITQDKIRQKELEALGVTVIRFIDSEILSNLENVVEDIKLKIL